MARYSYSVRTDLGFPILARFGDRGAETLKRDGTWEEAPHLNSIRSGGGLFMEYDDISEEEAREYMRKIIK